MSKDGLIKCEEALDRLLNHCPVNSQFSAIKAHEITPAMTSVEAGFDKGYLKRSRPAHAEIIGKIDSVSKKKKLKPKRHKGESVDEKYARQDAIMQTILTQNLKLMMRIREYDKRYGALDTES